MIGQNNDVVHGVTNGTTGYLQDIILQEGATVRIVQLTEHLQIPSSMLKKWLVEYTNTN